MNTEIIVALIASGGGFLGSLVGVIASSKLTTYRIQQLENKVEKHNTVIERTYKLEETEAVMQEQIRVANHRIADLEKQKQLAEMLAESCAKKERKDVFALEEERKTLLTERAAKKQMADETRKQAAVLANLLQNARKEWQERMHAAAA